MGWTEQDEGRGVARRTSIGACALMRVVVLLVGARDVDVGCVVAACGALRFAGYGSGSRFRGTYMVVSFDKQGSRS